MLDINRAQCDQQVTDAYLLATAEQHKGKLVTFDRKFALAADTDCLELLTADPKH